MRRTHEGGAERILNGAGTRSDGGTLLRHDPLVCSQARALDAAVGSPHLDREDFENSLWVAVLEAERRHDPSRGSLGPLLATAIKNGAVSIYRRETAQCRDAARVISLAGLIDDDGSGRSTDENSGPREQGLRELAVTDDPDLRLDVADRLAALDADTRAVAMLITNHSERRAAALLGESRDFVRTRKQRLRKHFAPLDPRVECE